MAVTENFTMPVFYNTIPVNRT